MAQCCAACLCQAQIRTLPLHVGPEHFDQRGARMIGRSGGRAVTFALHCTRRHMRHTSMRTRTPSFVLSDTRTCLARFGLPATDPNGCFLPLTLCTAQAASHDRRLNPIEHTSSHSGCQLRTAVCITTYSSSRPFHCLPRLVHQPQSAPHKFALPHRHRARIHAQTLCPAPSLLCFHCAIGPSATLGCSRTTRAYKEGGQADCWADQDADVEFTQRTGQLLLSLHLHLSSLSTVPSAAHLAQQVFKVDKHHVRSRSPR